MTTKCKPYMSEGEARGIAIWAARDAGLNTDDVANVRSSPDGCTVYFEEWNPFPWTNTDHSVHLQKNGWKVRAETYYVFGEGVPPFACGGSPTGSEYVTEDMRAMLDNEYNEAAEGADIEGCIDSDNGIFPDTYGTVSFVSKDGIKDIYDVCKTPQILVEADCSDYAGPDTVETMLTSFIFCHCVNGKCVDEPLDVCHDPLPESPPEGGTVWSWSQGNVVLDYCADDDSIRHITCDEDGIEKQDITPCPEDQICANGMCGVMACFDDDPENNVFIKGSVTVTTGIGSISITDNCVSKDTVHETVCDSAAPKGYVWKMKECPEDYECQNGTCVEGVACKPLECKDDDPQNDPTLLGTINYTCEAKDGVIFEQKLSDYCLGFPLDFPGTEGILLYDLGVELYCEDNKVKSEIVKCPSGMICLHNSCEEYIPSVCEDSDGGLNTSEYGTSTLTITLLDDYGMVPLSQNDFCMNQNELVELYCQSESGPIAWKKLDCGDNKSCIGGKCIACTDSDPDNDPEILGYVSDINKKTQSDYCVGDEIVQVFCNANGEVDATEPVPCQSGQCNEGVCI